MSSITSRSSRRPRGDRQPAWLAPVDKVLALAVDRIHLISAVTPTNAVAELLRLQDGWRRGLEPSPDWRYEPRPVPLEVRRALDLVARRLEAEPPLGPLYAARARELVLEASMIDAVGAPKLRTLAHSRFVDGVDGLAAAEGADRADGADRLEGLGGIDEVEAWLASPARDLQAASPAGDFPGACEGDDEAASWVVSDDARDPRSLLAAMRAAIGAERLPWRVVVEPTLASLAATGDGVVFVATGRRMRVIDVRRTVMHEIAGHVLPRHRAVAEPAGIFAIGTSRGVDDQEGRALLLERASGFWDHTRCQELRWRHAAASLALEGASFVDLVRALLAAGAPVEQAVRIVCRVLRGGTQAGAGIAREVLYLPAMARVAAATRRQGEVVGTMMCRGRIAASLASTVAVALGATDDPTIAVGSA